MDKNTYNMDENGYMMSVVESSKMIFSKSQKQAFINQASNWEWALFIAVIDTTAHQLLLFVILTGKSWKNNCYPEDTKQKDRISPGKNGWTNNKFCIEWIRDCFKLETKYHLCNDSQISIIDGHVSYISTEFI